MMYMATIERNMLFHELVERLARAQVAPIDKSDDEDRILVQQICGVAERAIEDMRNDPITALRANEVGQQAKRRVRQALLAETELKELGGRRSLGYPDFALVARGERRVYLECKTYDEETIDQRFRRLYLSEPIGHALAPRANHLLLGFEMVHHAVPSQVYMPTGFRLVDLHSVPLRRKIEWSAGNREVYSQTHVLCEGFSPRS